MNVLLMFYLDWDFQKTVDIIRLSNKFREILEMTRCTYMCSGPIGPNPRLLIILDREMCLVFRQIHWTLISSFCISLSVENLVQSLFFLQQNRSKLMWKVTTQTRKNLNSTKIFGILMIFLTARVYVKKRF